MKINFTSLIVICILLASGIGDRQVFGAPGSLGNLWGSGSYTHTGDFNGDGFTDIVSPDSKNVYVYLSNGADFNLQTWTQSGHWGGSEYTWSADFNNDGKTDIVTANDGTIYAYYTNETGTGFREVTSTNLDGWGSAGYVQIGDFDQDGYLDIASPDHGNVHMKLSRNGTGFRSETWSAANINWGSASYTWVGDFDGDGYVDDLATAVSNNISVLTSNGRAFSLAAWSTTARWGGGEYSFAGDFNADRKTDLASANSGNVYMYLSTGNGFTLETWTVPDHWGSSTYTWVADLNGDNAADLLSANGSTVYVHLSTGSLANGGFSSDRWPVPGHWGSASYTWIGDYNADGNADIASAKYNDMYMSLSRRDRFANAVWYSYQDSGCSVAGATVAANNLKSKPACRTYPVAQWAKNFDQCNNLSMNLSYSELGYVTRVTQGMSLTGLDGLYIFVYKGDGTFLMRRSDRPGDSGEYGVVGSSAYDCKLNPASSPTKCANTGTESPHMFVRHTQLNNGYAPAYSAGQLQIYGGKVIWISNASGHFFPAKDSLQVVRELLDDYGIPREETNFLRDHDWNQNKMKDEL